MPSSNVPGFLKLMFDGFIHSGIYGLLAVLWFLAYSNFKIKGIAWVKARNIFLFCSLLGLLLEGMQEYFVAGRTFEISDVLANIIGASVVLVVNFVLLRRDHTKNRTVA